MGTEFDDDTAIHPDGDGRWQATIADRWHIGAGPNGGFMASYPLKAMFDISPFPDPLTMTTHFLQRPAYAPATIEAAIVHAGKAHAYLEAKLTQEHGAVLTALAVFGTYRRSDTTLIDAKPPLATPPHEVPLIPTPEGMPFVERFRYRVPVEQYQAVWDPTPAPPLVFGWVQLADGRPLDPVAVPLFMDSFPPAVFPPLGPGLAPTIELTVHFRNRPRTPWHLAEFRTRFLTGGYMEEDGELWDEDGRLVAQSRQLARFTPAPPG